MVGSLYFFTKHINMMQVNAEAPKHGFLAISTIVVMVRQPSGFSENNITDTNHLRD